MDSQDGGDTEEGGVNVCYEPIYICYDLLGPDISCGGSRRPTYGPTLQELCLATYDTPSPLDPRLRNSADPMKMLEMLGRVAMMT